MDTTIGRRPGRAGMRPAGDRFGIDAETSPTPSVRGRPVGEEAWTGARRGVSLATALGAFSVALGVAQLLAPRELTRLVGMRPRRTTTAVVRAMGLREVGHGLGILANRRSKEWIGTRIGGDLLDLALLGVALAKSERPQRTLLAAGGVLGAFALDVLATQTLAQSRKAPTPYHARGAGVPARASVTIRRPAREVYAFWRDFTNLPRFVHRLDSVEILDARRSRWRAAGPAGAAAAWTVELTADRTDEWIAWRAQGPRAMRSAGVVHFRETPRGETVVTVEMRYALPGGRLAAALLKLLRREPGQQLADDLRRLAQVLEAGGVTVSDATALPRPRPARPPESAAAPPTGGVR